MLFSLPTAEGSYYYPVIYPALSSGVRRAELLGLRWRDTEFDIVPSISVNRVLYKRRDVCELKGLKTTYRRRLVPMAPKLAAFLRDYKEDVKSAYQELGKELSLDDPLFANAVAKPLNPSSLDREFKRILGGAGMEKARFHDLCHTFASLMLFWVALNQTLSLKPWATLVGHLH